MIRFPFWSVWKSKWLARQEATLQQEFQLRLQALQQAQEQQLQAVATQTAEVEVVLQKVERLKKAVADSEVLLQDRQIAVQHASEELRQQLRLLEAKASPTEVWSQAMAPGYRVALETLTPLMREGMSTMLDKVRQDAIDQTLKNINPLRPVHELLVKRKELEAKRDILKGKPEQTRYTTLLEALEWALNGHSLR